MSTYEEVQGIEWCPVHQGVMNEDDHVCDFASDDEEVDEDGQPRPCKPVSVYMKADEPEGIKEMCYLIINLVNKAEDEGALENPWRDQARDLAESVLTDLFSV